MDIAVMATVSSNVRVCEQANIDVLKMAMNSSKQDGQDIAEMIQSMNPNLGNNIDTRV
ncbi:MULTISPECIES: YjfB family protein [Clostridium]|uniref:YjfB family protein n=1 Tax=Clostridium TaxID=1485 RepID=UPI000825E4A6|nr:MULTISPECIES: YjfB family protein [Clostridium]PJI07219.1 putative motility protein [Clostridium sp. CT7]